MSLTKTRVPRVRVVAASPPLRDPLPRPGDVVVERTFALSRGVDASAIRRLVTTFAIPEHANLGRARDRHARDIRSDLIDTVRSVLSFTDSDGRYSYQSLRELERHLGRRRVRIFDLDLDGRWWNWKRLRVRSDGPQVKVRASAFGRAEARGKAVESVEEAVLLLGLVAPADARTRAFSRPRLRYDAFISHASDDAAAVALPLRDALKSRGYSVWLDRFVLKVGDSLRRSIDAGLLRSRHGVVVLSPSFFAKRKVWTARELDGLFSREQVIRRRTILPVLHNLSPGELATYSPMLADRVAASTTEGIEAVARDLVAAMGAPLKRRMQRRAATSSARGRSRSGT